MSDRASASEPIQPLPTTIVERYFARHQHGDGMVFDLWFDLHGDVDVDGLWEAWQETLPDFPRLHSRIMGRGKNAVWQPQPIEKQHCFDLHDGLPIDASPRRHLINAQRGHGARVDVYRVDETLHWVQVSFHHACCDGFGTARIMSEFIKRYQETCNQEAEVRVNRRTISPSNVESDSKEQASSNGPTTSKMRLPNLSNAWLTIRGRNVHCNSLVTTPKTRSHLTQPSELPSTATPDPPLHHRLSQSGCHRYPGGIRLTLDDAIGQQLRRRLRADGIPLNDFAVAATFWSLEATIAEIPNRGKLSQRSIMILNPINLRSWNQRYDAANHVGFALLRRYPFQFAEKPDGLSSVHQQLDAVRRHGFATELITAIGWSEAIPGALPVVEKIGWFTPTASVTCLSGLKLGKRLGMGRSEGRKNFGNAVGGDLTLTGPVQVGGGLSITVWDIGEGIGLTFRAADSLGSTDLALKVSTHWQEQVRCFIDS